VDLRSRWLGLVVLLFSLGTLVGCATLQGDSRQSSGSSSLVVVTPQLDFGTVVVGQSKTLTATVLNRTAFVVKVTQATVASSEFRIVSPSLPFIIRPGQSLSIQVQFAPQSVGSPSAMVALGSSTAQASGTIMLMAQAVAAGQLTPSAPSINFGNIQVGQSSTRVEVLTNTGSTSVTVSQLAVSGTGFQLNGASVPFTLGPGQSQSLNVVFSPASSGAASGSIAVNSNVATTVSGSTRGHFRSRASDTQPSSMTIALSGTGAGSTSTGTLSPSLSSVNLGNVQVNGSASNTVVLQNTGSASVTISQASVTGTGFSMTGLSTPATVAAGQSASFTVSFAPKTAGIATGNVAITSDATNSSLNIGLSGTAVTPGSLTTGSSVIAFGSVQVGQNQKQTATITNSGGSSVTISSATITGAGFTLSGISTPMTLAAGQGTTFNVTFAPSTATSASGTVTVASNASGSPLTWSLTGTGVSAGALTANPSSLSFGSVPTNTTKSLQEILTNSGGTTVHISGISASGSYSVTGASLPITLAAGASTSFNVVFAPTTSGAANTNLTVASDASNASLSIPMSATGVTPGSLSAGTSPLSFGTVTVGQTGTLSETITNSGGTTVTVSQLSAAGTGYSVTGVTSPFTLAAGASKSFNVVFAPTAAGTPSGTLTVTSDATNPTLTVSLSGTAVTVGSLAAANSPLSFGSVTIGQSQTLSETITNGGGTTVTVSQVAATGTGYSVTGVTTPFTLASGASKSFNVVFAPTTTGTPTGSLTVTSNATNATLTVTLSGTAIASGSLTAGTSPLSFGSVVVGQTQTLSETITNSGGSTVNVSQVSTTGSGYSVSGVSTPFTLAAGASKSFNIVFAPTAAGNPTGTLTVTSDASNSSLQVPLSGTATSPGVIASNPTSLSFGSVQVGNSSTKSEILSNTGGTAIKVSQIAASGTGYSISGVTVPLTINAGQSFTFSATFTPQTSGSQTGSISVTSDASNTLPAISLTGTGTAVGTFGVSPTSFGFGSVTVGQSKNMTATLSASGGSVTVNSASVNSAEFSISGPALPLTIAAGQTATFTITFRPQSSGSASATVTFATNAAGSPLTENLTGTGAAAPVHRVDLNWTGSTSSVSGYNIYRSATSGSGYVKLNSSLNVSTSFSDSSVAAGTTYFYVTTAVDSSGMESSYSNQVQATIPTP
jgi:hypothetical protein